MLRSKELQNVRMIKMPDYYIAKLTSKGQVTLPVEVRNQLTVKEGDYLLFEKVRGRYHLRKANLLPSEEFAEYARPIREHFKKSGITTSDVERAVQWARKNKKQ